MQQPLTNSEESPQNYMRQDDLTRIRQARGPFSALVATYALEVFNDQFFKQSVMLMAVASVSLGPKWQGILQVIFYLPFVIFSWIAGWLADRFAKRTVVLWVKLSELLIIIVGAIGLMTNNWPLLFTAFAAMGTRGTIFSPSINGSIPELYPDFYVTKANGLVKMLTTVAMLMGIAFAGRALGWAGTTASGVPLGQKIVAIGAVVVAFLGVLTSLGMARKAPAKPTAPFPWQGPLDTIRTFARMRQDRLLTIAVVADSYFWFLGSLMVQLINALGVKQFHFGPDRTSYLAAAEAIGIAIGGILSAKLAAGPRWYRLLPAATLGMGVAIGAAVFVPALPEAHHLAAMFITLIFAGIAGGLFVVPLESFIQVRPSPEEKGTILGTANVSIFAGMLIAGPAAYLLNSCFPLNVTISFAIAGAATALVGLWLWLALPEKE